MGYFEQVKVSQCYYSTNVLIHKGFMNYLRLMFSGIGEAEVKDLNYCLLLIVHLVL